MELSSPFFASTLEILLGILARTHCLQFILQVIRRKEDIGFDIFGLRKYLIDLFALFPYLLAFIL